MHKVLAATIVAIAASFACGGDDTPNHADGSLLAGVPNSEINGSTNSMKLEAAPDGASPAVDSHAAEETARANQQGNGDILETVLLNYTDLVKEPPTPRLVWAVNFDPATVVGVPPMGCMDNCPSQTYVVYSFVLIDANTGEFIVAAETSGFGTPTPEQ